jgi:hypothetical protein
MVLLVGTDFFTSEVLTLRGLSTYYVLFFMHIESRRVYVAGITVRPNEAWMRQIARNVTMDDCGALRDSAGSSRTKRNNKLHPFTGRPNAGMAG